MDQIVKIKHFSLLICSTKNVSIIQTINFIAVQKNFNATINNMGGGEDTNKWDC